MELRSSAGERVFGWCGTGTRPFGFDSRNYRVVSACQHQSVTQTLPKVIQDAQYVEEWFTIICNFEKLPK